MKIITLLSALLFSISGFCQQLFLTNYTDTYQTEILYSSESTSIHHIGSDFIIATTSNEIPTEAIVLKQNPWSS